ncbi:hypothetical protein ABVT39_016659 [Epinephelus coioides]
MKRTPQKPKMCDSRTLSKKSSTPGSSSLVPTESTQPGGAAGPQPGGATGPQPGGATGPQPGGAARPQPGGAAGPQMKRTPQKPKMCDSRTLSKKSSTPGSSSLVPTESTQPGGAAGPQPGGATGPQPFRATGPQPGGATVSQPGGATGPQPFRATGPQPFRATGPQPGGAAGPQPGGAAGPQPGGAAGPQPGGAAVSQLGEDTGPQPGGAVVSQLGEDTGPQPDGAVVSQLGEATGPQPGGAVVSQLGEATGPQPDGATGTQLGEATISQPGEDIGPHPGGAVVSQLGEDTGTQLGGATMSQPGGSTVSQPGGATGPQPFRATGPQPFRATGSQPFRATGSQPFRATGPQPFRATGPQPFRATGPQPFRATGPQSGGATGPQPFRATGPQPGGATGPQPGGATGPQPFRATGPQPGEATGPQPGGATGPQPGGATGPQPFRATGPQPGGATGPQPGGATGPQPFRATGPQPGEATGPQPGEATGPQPGGATGPQPGGAVVSQPFRATVSLPGEDTRPQPGGSAVSLPGEASGTQLGGATVSQPGEDTGTQPEGATDSQPGGAAGSQPGGATGPQTFKCNQRKVKEENDGDPRGEHLHRFTVKLSPADRNEYTVDCDQPRTVLEATKTIEDIKGPDENIVIQLGKADKKYSVPTHFPCTCVKDKESLIISRESQKVEEAREKMFIYSRHKYSVFSIETVGGLYTRQKKLFRNKALKQFKYLCVYGEKGMTVEEALKRDGRFIDDLGVFELSDSNTSQITKCTQKVDNLDGKEFNIRLPRKRKANNEEQQENVGASNNSPQKCDTKRVRGVVHQRRISVQTAVEESGSIGEIHEMQQFPALKEWMEKRFPENSYQTALNLKKENFGKIQRSFSEVHRVRKLLELGKSVCKVAVKDGRQGTGFVLFDNFILTNAHLFKGCVEGQKLMEGTEVSVFFNYEDPMPYTNYSYFQMANSYICYSEGELDYAVLELKPEGQKPNQTTQTEEIKVPPGLLKIFGPMPPNGEACLIGHPAGGVKRMDPTCIIEKEKREQAVRDYLHPYKDSLFIVHSISHLVKEQNIDNIMMGGSRAENIATYNTFMYHGSSGSPVFDARCRVFGLHTAGYTYGFRNHKESVIEFAQPLLTIFKHFVSKLKESGNEGLLKRVQEETNGNPYLTRVLSSMGTCTDVPADSDEPMQTE